MSIINQIHGKMRSEEPVSLTWLAPVRMLVITMIAFGYASTMSRGPQEAEYLRMFGYDPSWYGISILFMVSGFLALRSLQRHGSALKFLISRCVRNVPIVAVFALLVVLLIFPLLGDMGATGLGQHIQYLIKVISCISPGEMTPGLLDNALYICTIQGGLWTFRWGAIAFIATAVLWMIGGLRNRRQILLLSIILLLAYAAFVFYGIQTTDHHPAFSFIRVGLRLGWAYMLGMCAYAYRHTLPRTLFIPLVIIAAASIQYYALRWTPFIEISTELGLGYLVYLGITSRRGAPNSGQKPEQKPDQKNGRKSIPDLSLGLYVFNWPVTQIVLLLLPGLTPLSLFAVGYPITILIAFLAWRLVSKKLNARLVLD
ncbi:MAG: hypothetical protein COA69_07165 [Robiginitomaculum sp.]|nr:MAG: hypothetical protein COA69_07165 [Robiginitomaculum sp.]